MFNKILIMLAILFAISTQTFAQNESELIGKWDVEFTNSGESAVLEFKNVNGTLIGYFTSYTDSKGKAHKTNDQVHTNIQFDGEKGKSCYVLKWQDQSLFFETNIKMIDEDTIEAMYNYNGINIKETWVKKD